MTGDPYEARHSLNTFFYTSNTFFIISELSYFLKALFCLYSYFHAQTQIMR